MVKKNTKTTPKVQKEVKPKTKTGEKKLTEKQKLFAMEFSKDLNATRAYQEVYWVSANVARASWPRLLANVSIMNIVKAKVYNRFEELEIDGKRVLDRLVELVDRCMERKPLMVRRWKEYFQETDARQDPITWERKQVWVRTFDAAWANSALEKLGKYFKLFTEQHEHTIKWDVNSLLDTILDKQNSQKQ